MCHATFCGHFWTSIFCNELLFAAEEMFAFCKMKNVTTHRSGVRASVKCHHMTHGGWGEKNRPKNVYVLFLRSIKYLRLPKFLC